MAQNTTCTAFQTSCLEASTYPENLMQSSTRASKSSIKRYKVRLEQLIPTLCLEDGQSTEVRVRDLYDREKPVQKRNLLNEVKLDTWFGIDHVLGKSPESPCNQADTSLDPRCRFVFLFGNTSRSKLKITRNLLLKIMTYYQVMPEYIDLISLFGAQREAREPRHGAFFEQSFLGVEDYPPTLLGAGGKHFEICYNLRGVTNTTEDQPRVEFMQWSIRSAAVLHQLDIATGNTLWIVTKGRDDVHQRFKSLTSCEGRPECRSFSTPADCFRSSLFTHLMLCQWAAEDWRWYVRWLEEVSHKETRKVVYDPHQPDRLGYHYETDDIQCIQLRKDSVGDAILAMQTNIDVMETLKRSYNRLNRLAGTSPAVSSADIENLIAEIDGIISNMKIHISRAQLLSININDMKDLALQLVQRQSVVRAEILNAHLRKEAIMMRIITIVTLLYLPPMFVSTFFSTDIIHYSSPGDDSASLSSYSSLAMERWCQVTIPLTILTLSIAAVAFKMATADEQATGSMPEQRWSLEIVKGIKQTLNRARMIRLRGQTGADEEKGTSSHAVQKQVNGSSGVSA